MRVLIIGAGLGGLCLAHALVGAGHDVTVFERNSRTGEQPASYGIHLNADGLQALHDCLPAENWAMIDAAALPARDLIRFHDPARGVLTTWNRETPRNATDPVTRRRAISRGALRAALLHGLDRPGELDGTGFGDVGIEWDKRFIRYRQDEGGTVTVEFADGTTATGDLLVGADGSNSAVRQQRLPDLAREDLGIINVAGRVPMTPELADIMPADLLDSAINNIVPARAGWMFVSTWNTIDPTISAPALNSAIASAVGPATAVEVDATPGDTTGSVVNRYIVWAWVGRRESFPAEVEGMPGHGLKKLVQDRVASWPEHFATFIERTDPHTIVPVTLRTMPELAPWAPSPVTVLGDAIHNMTPMAGIGANTAFRDAATLHDAVAEHPDDAAAAAGAYEQAMRGYGNAALALSRRNATNASSASAGSRRVFRSLLRLTRRVPTLENRIFKTPNRRDLASTVEPPY